MEVSKGNFEITFNNQIYIIEMFRNGTVHILLHGKILESIDMTTMEFIDTLDGTVTGKSLRALPERIKEPVIISMMENIFMSALMARRIFEKYLKKMANNN